MNAGEYRVAAARVSARLDAETTSTLVAIARSMYPVLSQVAEGLLFERGAVRLLADGRARARSSALHQTSDLMRRLRKARGRATMRAAILNAP